MTGLSGYQRTSLQGMGCGLDTSCGCAGMAGLGDLLDPTTWGPADWLVAAAAGWIGWKVFGQQKRKRYVRTVRRRLGVVE